MGNLAITFGYAEVFIVVAILVFLRSSAFMLFVAPIGALLNSPCLPKPRLFSCDWELGVLFVH